ncbi:FimD/PapC N-terminal domain-containing protein [Klebsiella huaxiensis]|uniref:FimD/PapC N-terminal domain-containing protein n=1 Tax=Klebsiella huaxiensis TaxID=2153354 RepID=UPI0035E41649
MIKAIARELMLMKALKQISIYYPSFLAVWIALVLSSMWNGAQGRDFFNPALLEIDNPAMKGADLSAFESGAQAPGTYHVDVIINDSQVDTRDIVFYTVKDGGGEVVLEPCLTVEQLRSYGVKTAQFPALSGKGECVNL